MTLVLYKIVRIYTVIREIFYMIKLNTLLLLSIGTIILNGRSTVAMDTASHNDESVKAQEIVNEIVDFHTYRAKSGFVQALEECHNANEKMCWGPCARLLRLIHNDGNYDRKHIDYPEKTSEKMFNYAQHYGADNLNKIIESSAGINRFNAQDKHMASMWGRLVESGRLGRVLDAVRASTDAKHINNYFPKIIRDACEIPNFSFGCKSLQQMFHRKQMDNRGEYSPFLRSASIGEEWVRIEREVGDICNELNVSARTRHTLITLVRQGYYERNGGQCEEGPTLEKKQEDRYKLEEIDQFPEPLKVTCAFNRYMNPPARLCFEECARLRELVYDMQYSDIKSKYGYSAIHDHDSQEIEIWIGMWIGDIYNRERHHLIHNKSKTPQELRNKGLGNCSDKEVDKCIDDFKDLIEKCKKSTAQQQGE